MMWLDDFKLVNTKGGTRYIKADIEADAKPDTFPTDGTGIEGLSKNDKLEKGSSLFVVSTAELFFMDSNKEWH